MKRYVYLLIATWEDPFGCDPRPIKRTTTVFASHQLAESRAEKFKQIVRGQLKVDPDYPIQIQVFQMEVIEE